VIVQLSSEKGFRSDRLWVLVDGTKIGGSERRAVKVASYVDSLRIFKEVILLVTPELEAEYRKDQELNKLLSKSLIKVRSTDVNLGLQLLSTSTRLAMIKRLHRFYPVFMKVPTIYRFLLRRLSRIKILKKLIRNGDIVHCFVGDAARNGCLFLAEGVSNRIICEITSNRLLDRVCRQIETILGGFEPKARLYLKCVSETVYENFSNLCPAEFFEQRGVHLSPWAGPFVYMPADNNTFEKENVIIYASRFLEPKNPLLFCRTVKKLLDNGELAGWKVKIRGRGHLESQMKDILNSHIAKGVVNIKFSYDLGEELARSKVFVSLVVTGNYPSQSLFEAMRHGNILVLSRTGNTENHFAHPDVHLVELNEENLSNGLRKAVFECTSNDFEWKSQSMRLFYDKIVQENSYIRDLLSIYEVA
jgi:glycosyltransferase involved in cell wall biosynthesis